MGEGDFIYDADKDNNSSGALGLSTNLVKPKTFKDEIIELANDIINVSKDLAKETRIKIEENAKKIIEELNKVKL